MLRVEQRTGKTGAGFTLLEVLITVLILSIGLLGLSGLQVTGLRYNQSAYWRGQATLIAYDIIDRMRVNRDGVAAGAYDAIDSTATLPGDPNCVSDTAGCTAAQMAQHDIREWAGNFVNINNSNDFIPALPNASATVTRDAIDTTLFSVTISWQETEGDDAISQQLTMNFRLTDS